MSELTVFKEISQQEFKAKATPDKLVINRALSTSSFDVPTKKKIEVGVDELIAAFLKENSHADYLQATVFCHDPNALGSNPFIANIIPSKSSLRLVKYFERVDNDY